MYGKLSKTVIRKRIVKTTTFQGIECYIAYKALNEDLSNYKRNYNYELNNWYSAIEVDTNTQESCSYGCNLVKTPEWCLLLGDAKRRLFECYVPIKENDITFICGDEDNFRCKKFFLSNKEIEIEENMCCSTDERVDLLCQYNPEFTGYGVWELSEHQLNLMCQYNPKMCYSMGFSFTDFQVDLLEGRDEYIDFKLTENQVDLLCIHNPNFNYWDYKLKEHQVDLLCQYNPNFNHNDYNLNKHQQDILTKTRIVKN